MNFYFVRRCYQYISLSKISFLSVFLVLGGVTFLVIALCAPFLYWFEAGHPDANVTTFGDAVWLCYMIVTTVGFGDFYPVTFEGRLIAVPLAATGIGVFGTLAGYFGSLILDKVVRQATTDMLHEQNERIEVLARQNNELNEMIKSIAFENKNLNKLIVELSKNNETLNQKIDHDTDEILKALQTKK